MRDSVVQSRDLCVPHYRPCDGLRGLGLACMMADDGFRVDGIDWCIRNLVDCLSVAMVNRNGEWWWKSAEGKRVVVKSMGGAVGVLGCCVLRKFG